MSETESKWAERVRAWRSSGLSAPEYVQGRGFKETTLRWWASRLGRGRSTGQLATPSTAMVRMARVTTVARPSVASLMVRVGAAQVEVRAGVDRGLLRDLVDALGGGS